MSLQSITLDFIFSFQSNQFITVLKLCNITERLKNAVEECSFQATDLGEKKKKNKEIHGNQGLHEVPGKSCQFRFKQ